MGARDWLPGPIAALTDRIGITTPPSAGEQDRTRGFEDFNRRGMGGPSAGEQDRTGGFEDFSRRRMGGPSEGFSQDDLDRMRDDAEEYRRMRNAPLDSLPSEPPSVSETPDPDISHFQDLLRRGGRFVDSRGNPITPGEVLYHTTRPDMLLQGDLGSPPATRTVPDMLLRGDLGAPLATDNVTRIPANISLPTMPTGITTDGAHYSTTDIQDAGRPNTQTTGSAPTTTIKR